MKIRVKNIRKSYAEFFCGRIVRLNRGASAQVVPEADKDGNVIGPQSLLHAINTGDIEVVSWGELKPIGQNAAPEETAPAPAPEKTSGKKKNKDAALAAPEETAPALPGIPETPENQEEA